MKSYNTIFYLLFVLLIMGAFASMAQNNYGMKILGGVAVAFGIVFLIRFLESFKDKSKKYLRTKAELLSLSILSFLFSFRIFHFYFPFLEILFTLAGLVLAFIYGSRMVERAKSLQFKNATLAIIIFIYYLSLLMFIITLVILPFLPQYTNYTGALAFVFLIGFIMAGMLSHQYLIDGSEVSVYKQVLGYKDNSVILLSLFFVISLYSGLTRINMLPSMYSDDFPQAYFKLVDEAESGKEKPVNGKFRHQEFKNRYDAFLQKNRPGTP